VKLKLPSFNFNSLGMGIRLSSFSEKVFSLFPEQAEKVKIEKYKR
jgi:hypothetical protein